MWRSETWSVRASGHSSLAHRPQSLVPLTVGCRPMWCTDMDTFCTMWKRSPATVMVLPPLWGQQASSVHLQPQSDTAWGLGVGLT